MSSSDAAKVISGGDVSVDSETTVEIKIKTLDSQTYTLRVDKCVPVPALKEQIASVTGVLSNQQRLICRGRVLKDDQLLSAYHVEDGHTLHLVVREPHQLATPSTNHMGSEGASGSSSASGSAHNRSSQVAQSFVFESVNVDQGDIDTSVISRIISSMLDSFGSPSTGSGNMTTDVRDMISERLGRASSDNVLSDSTQAHPNPTNPQRERGPADLRPSSAVSLAQPTVIPDSFTTLSQYIGLMRDEFSREGFSAHVNEHITNAEDTGLRSHDSHFPAAQIGLPTPASLAEVLLSTRQLVVEQTGECLSQLARQLVDHTSITDPLTRLNMQASALRSGVLMRNLGSLFLELGRTTMTLRMGQSPAEAIVNAGPANFISATGPNPLMVQAVPFPSGLNSIGTNVVPANSGHVLGGEPHDAAFLPRNIEIRIRTARAVPVIATNTSEQAPAPHQQQDQRDPSRNSSSAPANVVHQAFLGGDPAVRVVPVPVRTVVNTSPSDSSTGSVRVIYPFVARVRQTVSGNASDTRATQQPTQQPLPQSTVIRENTGSNIGGAVRDDGHFPHNAVPFVTGLSASASEPAAYPGFSATVFVSSQQTPPDNNSGNGTQATDDSVRGDGTQTNDDSARGTESHDAARASDDQGVFLSNILRGIMPLIPQESEHGVSSANPGPSTAQVEGEDLNGSSSSQHQRDPADAPSPKRTKRNGD